MQRQSNGEVTQSPCVSCGGRGSSTCTACGGIGHVVVSTGGIKNRIPCTDCFGSGRITCVFCKGLGSVLLSAALVAEAGEDDAPCVFQFPPYEFVRHPTRHDMWACWQHKPGNCLDIGLTSGSSMRVGLTGRPTDTWLDIQDESGNQVPLSILIGSTGGLSGRWR